MIVSIGQAHSIAGVIPSLAEILPRPIMTFEPVRICKRDGVLLREPQSFVQQNDTGFDNLQRLEIYGGVHSRYKHHPLPVEIVQALLRSSASGSTVLRGVWGYAHGEPPHGDRLWSLVSQVPTITVVIEQAARMRETFAVIDTITETAGLVTSETVRGHQATATTLARGGLSLRPLR
jgi:PII-like signaling protein